jgi:hypothetical protein
MRVLHCPSSVIGHAWGLSRAERKLGLQSDVMYFKEHRFGYEADINLHLERKSWPLRAVTLSRFAVHALNTYDVFHFNFGASLLSTFYFPFAWDVPLIAGTGKKIFATFMGCDARMRSYTRKHFPYSACSPQYCRNEWCNSLTDWVRTRKIKMFSEKAEAIFCLNPDLCRFIPNAVFLPYSHVDLQEWSPAEDSNGNKGDEINIVHAPSDRSIKGTRYILETVRRLQRKGFRVRVAAVENASHKEVKQRLQNADIVIDQLLVGWYGGLAVEAMALGKPVISYIRQEDLKFIPAEMADDLPVVNANIENLDAVLMELVNNVAARIELGEKGRAYVEKWHDPVKVAQMTLEYYHGNHSKLLRNVNSRN